MSDAVPYVGIGRTYTYGHTEQQGIDAAMLDLLYHDLTLGEIWLLTSTEAEQRDASQRYDVPVGYVHRQRARLIKRLRERYQEERTNATV